MFETSKGGFEKKRSPEEQFEVELNQVQKEIQPDDEGNYKLGSVEAGSGKKEGENWEIKKGEGAESVQKVFQMILDEYSKEIKEKKVGQVDLRDLKSMIDILKETVSCLQLDPEKAVKTAIKPRLSPQRRWQSEVFLDCAMLKIKHNQKDLDTKELLGKLRGKLGGDIDENLDLIAERASKLCKLIGKENLSDGVDDFFKWRFYKYSDESNGYVKG